MQGNLYGRGPKENEGAKQVLRSRSEGSLKTAGATKERSGGHVAFNEVEWQKT